MMHNTILSERVASILAFLSLLSGPVLTSVDPSISGDIGSLLDFAQNPTREKIYRIKSLIRVYAILFAWGVFSSDQNLDRETDELLLYLDSLVPNSSFLLARREFVPRTLGAVSVRKALAVPLFGYHRPETPPRGPGHVLCYQSVESGETGTIEILRLDRNATVSYEGLGTRLSTSNPRLCVRIAKTGHDPLVTLVPPFSRNHCTRFSNGRYELFLADSPLVYSGKADRRGKNCDLYDPLEFRYVYFFPPETQRPVRFLRDVLTSMYGFTKDTVEPIVSAITEKLP
ncbi:MAG TPA: hypothetical protein PKH40_11330 [Treponemataceae bacterium]|nr:hypothetical protein [Treponemataceae bacterium]